MGLKIAIASGNWSNPAIWHTGTKPVAGDTVAANGFTITIDENATVATLSNKEFFGVSAVPVMTGYTTPSGIASALTEYNTNSYNAWKAFNGTVATNDDNWIGITGRPLPEWLQYEFSSPKVIIGYSLQNKDYDINRPTNWQFQAWDGSTWIVLDTVSSTTSQLSPFARTLTNTTAYSRYRIYITNSLSSSYLAIGELRLFDNNLDGKPAVNGGNFIIGPNVTVTCTTSIEASNVNILNWTGGVETTSTITSPILYAATSGNTFQINGAGTLNINIALATTQGGSTNIYNILNTGTINIIGSIRPRSTEGSGGIMIYIGGTAKINMTGDITAIPESSMLNCTIDANCTFTITGNITAGRSNYGFNLNTFCIVRITGSYTGIAGSGIAMFLPNTTFLEIVGPIIAAASSVVIYSNSQSTTLLLSGPFIYSPYGYHPVWATRYHLIPSITTYIEFRDNSTGGATFPGTIATTKRFISPASTSDSPSVSDVRFGTTYAFATLTGTLRMPVANQVTSGIQVDNTFGSAVLTIDGIWDYLVTNINTPDSIGMRLKNVSTPQTTGEQLEAFLKLD